MITVSEAWKDIQQRFILPQSHLELTCALTEKGLQELATGSGENESSISNIKNAISASDTDVEKYATNELNLWSLDGSFTIAPDNAPYDSGYIGNTDGSGKLTFTLPELQTKQIPGVTITWGKKNGEYPKAFTVRGINSSGDVAEVWLYHVSTTSFFYGFASIEGIRQPVVVGKMYVVTWGSMEYDCRAYSAGGSTMIGNASLLSLGKDTGEPFVIEILSDTIASITKRTSDSVSVSVGFRTKADYLAGEVSVTDNTDLMSVIDMEMARYDNVEVTVWEWCLPYRRVRIEKAILGHVLTMGKGDILNYTHEQHGDLNSGELPKNSIQFSLDNIDGRWNPSNPVGMERYLSERQRVKARYGMDVNGTIEWIDAGVFYLSEWRAPANGLEATFVARDVFDYLLNTQYRGITTGTLKELAQNAFNVANIPDDVTVFLDDHLSDYTATIPTDGEQKHTCAEIVQMCANAASCVIYQDREGDVHVERLNTADSGYLIGSALSYSHPEIELSKQLKEVEVSYGEDRLVYGVLVGTTGETQTVDNPLVSTANQAKEIALWVRDTYQTRRSVSGEYRADPRLDLFDIVQVESKYGRIAPVAITGVKYTFNGAFAGSYTGRVISEVG